MPAPAKPTLDIAAIRRGLILTRGGWEHASDADILALWHSLSNEQQREVLTAEERAAAAKGKPSLATAGN
jgi:hypothetical protein